MNEQTFYFTNMAPQAPYLNGGLWAWLEVHVQQLALEAGEAWVWLVENRRNGISGF